MMQISKDKFLQVTNIQSKKCKLKEAQSEDKKDKNVNSRCTNGPLNETR